MKVICFGEGGLSRNKMDVIKNTALFPIWVYTYVCMCVCGSVWVDFNFKSEKEVNQTTPPVSLQRTEFEVDNSQ